MTSLLFLMILALVHTKSSEASNNGTTIKTDINKNYSVNNVIEDEIYNENEDINNLEVNAATARINNKLYAENFKENESKANPRHKPKYRHLDKEISGKKEYYLKMPTKIKHRKVTNYKKEISVVKNGLGSIRVTRSTPVDDTPPPDPRCQEGFNSSGSIITHPHSKNSSENKYYRSIDCVRVIDATPGKVIEITFIDLFSIEYHPECAYDYLEIRDGEYGYSRLLGKVCGDEFPEQMVTTTPTAWLKFHSDDTIETEGFHLSIKYREASSSQMIPDSCKIALSGLSGEVDTKTIDPLCRSGSVNLDVQWKIMVDDRYHIYLNFTKYELVKPNNCDDNIIEIFGSSIEEEGRLAKYCGSVAESVVTPATKKSKNGSTIPNKGNVMYIRLYVSKAFKESTKIRAKYTAFRILNAKNKESCEENEFDCDDNTCIQQSLTCDGYADCRLKTDEDPEICKTVTKSALNEKGTRDILIIFCVILSGMVFVMMFKCFKKLYTDHKLIKEQHNQSLEDRLDCLVERRLTLDAEKIKQDLEPRASLERENRTNEWFKRKRDSYSKRKRTSSSTDFNDSSLINLEDESWSKGIDNNMATTEREVSLKDENKSKERKHKKEDRNTRDSVEKNVPKDVSKNKHKKYHSSREDISTKDGTKHKEHQNSELKDIPRTPRMKRYNDGLKESREDKDRKDASSSNIGDNCKNKTDSDRNSDARDISFSPYDTIESGCQTRDSLFQTVPFGPGTRTSAATPKSSGAFTDRSSGALTGRTSVAATARPTPPAPGTSELTIELIATPRQDVTPQNEPEGRPISTETTKSAPDVIIVSPTH